MSLRERDRESEERREREKEGGRREGRAGLGQTGFKFTESLATRLGRHTVKAQPEAALAPRH